MPDDINLKSMINLFFATKLKCLPEKQDFTGATTKMEKEEEGNYDT